jgi:hypothetical protein
MQTKTQCEPHANSTAKNEGLKCWNSGGSPLCLRIELGDGTQFILPYGYFESAKFVRESDKEILHLHFKAHQFAIRGDALGELCAAFQTLSVEFLKECPRRYQALAKSQAFIEKIEVSNETREPNTV